jgi:hypothetical protein
VGSRFHYISCFKFSLLQKFMFQTLFSNFGNRHFQSTSASLGTELQEEVAVCLAWLTVATRRWARWGRQQEEVAVCLAWLAVASAAVGQVGQAARSRAPLKVCDAAAALRHSAFSGPSAGAVERGGSTAAAVGNRGWWRACWSSDWQAAAAAGEARLSPWEGVPHFASGHLRRDEASWNGGFKRLSFDLPFHRPSTIKVCMHTCTCKLACLYICIYVYNRAPLRSHLA